MDYNYGQLLSFDLASSVTLTKTEATRKLAAWDDRMTISDYPSNWLLDLLTGEFVTLSFFSSDESTISWEGTDSNAVTHNVSVSFTDGLPTGWVYSAGADTKNSATVVEGDFTTDGDVRLRIVDPSIRTGTNELKIQFDGINRLHVNSDLDNYCNLFLGVIEDTVVKNHEIEGTWRLAEVRKLDSATPDTVNVVLVYKEGYSKTLIFNEAIIMNMEDYRNNNSTLLVKFPNIDPRYAETAKAAYAPETTFTNPVFGGVRYDGYWTNVKMETTEVSSRYADLEDSVSVILWLSRHNNDDMIWTFYGTENEFVIDLFKYHMLEAGKTDLEDNYYFAPTGVYYSTDGSTILKHNGVDYVGGDTIADVGGKLMGVSVAGRMIEISEKRREDDRTTDLFMRITFTTADEQGTIYRANYHQIVTEINLVGATPDSETEFSEALATDPNGNWYHVDAGTPTNYDRKNGLPASGTLASVSAELISAQVANRSIRIRSFYDVRDKYWSIQYLIQILKEDVRLARENAGDTTNHRLTSMMNPYADFTIERGSGISEADMRTLNGYYSTCPIGTTRRINVQETGEGTYSYEAIEVTTTGMVADFACGTEHVYVGYNYEKKPTCSVSVLEGDTGYTPKNPESDNYYLVGSTWTATPPTPDNSGTATTFIPTLGQVYHKTDTDLYYEAILTSGSSQLFTNTTYWKVVSLWEGITGDSIVTPTIARDENGTWNWNIRVTKPDFDNDSYGEDDPTLDTGNFLFEYGEPNDIFRWTGRYLMEDILSGTVSLIGSFKTISGASDFEYAYLQYTGSGSNYTPSVSTGWADSAGPYGGLTYNCLYPTSASPTAQEIDVGNIQWEDYVLNAPPTYYQPLNWPSGTKITFYVQFVSPANNDGNLTFEFRAGASWAAGTTLCTFQPPANGATAITYIEEFDISDLGITGVNSVFFNITGTLDPVNQEIGVAGVGFYADPRYDDTGEYGRHGDLTGRRVSLKSIQNERIIEGKISYDVYENIKTADINTDDAWFIVGTTEALNRDKETLINDIIDAQYDGDTNGQLWATAHTGISPLRMLFDSTPSTKPSTADAAGNTDGIVQLNEADSLGQFTPDIDDSMPAILRLQRCVKQRKTILRERKYFVRRPTVEDLQNTMDKDVTSLSDAMAAIYAINNDGPEPDGNLAITYDVLRLGAYNFAIEKTTVAVSTKIYRDDDAFDRFIDSNGDPALGVQFALLHTDATSPMKDMMPDETEA